MEFGKPVASLVNPDDELFEFIATTDAERTFVEEARAALSPWPFQIAALRIDGQPAVAVHVTRNGQKYEDTARTTGMSEPAFTGNLAVLSRAIQRSAAMWLRDDAPSAVLA